MAPPCDLNPSKAGGREGGRVQMALQPWKEDVGIWRRERWEQPSTPADPWNQPGLCSILSPSDPPTTTRTPHPWRAFRGTELHHPVPIPASPKDSLRSQLKSNSNPGPDPLSQCPPQFQHQCQPLSLILTQTLPTRGQPLVDSKPPHGFRPYHEL